MPCKDEKKRKEYNIKYYKEHRVERAEYIKQWHKDNPEYGKQYFKKNKEKILERRNEWRKTEKGKLSSQKSHKKYYDKNSEKIKEYIKKWKERNPEYSKEWDKNYPEYHKKWDKTEKGKANSQRYCTKRRMKLNGILNTLTAQEWLDILEQHDYRCAYCGVEFDCELPPEKDHVIPISKGGNNTKENVVPACRSCNSKKWNKLDYKPEMAVI